MRPSDAVEAGTPDLQRLLALASQGSTEALGQLLEACRDYLLGIANRELDPRLRPKGGASDIVQEAFLEAQRIFGRFEGDEQQLLAWLRAILLHKLDDFRRRYHDAGKRQLGREVGLEQAGSGAAALADASPTPSSVVSEQEQAELVRRAVHRLPEHYRQVIVWRQWEGLPFEEIARRLEKSVDAARMLWWRAVERLEEELRLPP